MVALGRATAWLLASAVTLLLGSALLLALGGVIAMTMRGELVLTAVQALALRWLVGTVLLEGLLPHLVVTGLAWLVVVRLAPDVEKRWRSIGFGVLALAMLCFPAVGRWSLTSWTPVTAWDYVNTSLLMSGGVSIALLAPRRWFAVFGPGRLCGSSRSGADELTSPP